MAKAPAGTAPAKPKAPQPQGKAQPKKGEKPGAAPAAPAGRPKPTGDTPPRLRDRFRTTAISALIGMPPETVPMALMRPLSGSGSLGVMTELMKVHGPDSLIGVMASTMYGRWSSFRKRTGRARSRGSKIGRAHV